MGNNVSSELAETYLSSLNPSKKKISKAVINIALEYAKSKGKSIESLNSDDIKNIQEIIHKQVSKNTAKVYQSHLRSFIAWLEEGQKKPTDNIQVEGQRSESPLSPKSKFDYEEWTEKRDNSCPDCQAEPYRKDSSLYIFCSRPNWIGKGKAKGLIGEVRLEACLRTQNYYSRIKKNKEKEGEIADLKAEVERLKSKLEERQSIEANITADKISSIQKGESIFCHFKKRIIPLWQCFDLQNEYAKTPKHFIPPSSEYCPCQKFEALEHKEMAKYQNVETIPWMNPEIKDIPIEAIEKLYGIGEPFKEGKDDDLFDSEFLDEAFPIEIERFGEDRRDLIRDGKSVSLLEIEEKERIARSHQCQPKGNSLSWKDVVKAWYWCPLHRINVLFSTIPSKKDIESCEDCTYDNSKPCQNYLSFKEKI